MKEIIQAVCFGEVLWDNFGRKKKMGGAPLNLSIRLNSFGIKTSIISQVGNDSFGNKLKIHERNNSSCLFWRSSLG